MTKQANLSAKLTNMKVIEGDRARLEAEIVENLFLGSYDSAKVVALARRGKLRLVADQNQESASNLAV